MLRTRIITALMLFAVFAGALFLLPASGWASFAALVALAGLWEWGALMGLPGSGRGLLALSGGVLMGISAWMAPVALGLGDGFLQSAWMLGRYFFCPAALFWVLVVPLWLAKRWSVQRSVLGALIGLLVVVPAWVAMVQLRQLGVIHLLAVMAIAWVADIGAYFSGRRFGRRKLAPSISPGKTWEGALGGGCAVLLLGGLAFPRLPGLEGVHPLLLIVALAVLTVFSVIGDLFESLLKRQAGLKDSSNLLPGHGGVLDRIDSLTSTLPLAALFLFATRL